MSAIPSNLRYQANSEPSPARRYRTNIQPQNGTNGYVANNTIIINIPTRANTFLIPSESVLKFRLSLTASAVTTIGAFDSQGVHACIQRLRVFHGSNLLQDIDNYGDLTKILFDYQAALDTTQGRLSITQGTANDYTGPASSVDGVVVKPVNRGRTGIVAAAVGSNIINTYAINLISLVGALAGNKYLPLGEMTASPLRVELVLAPSGLALGAFPAGITGFTLDNVEYIAEFLELPDSAINAIKSDTSLMQMVVPDWRNYQYSANIAGDSTTTVSVPIPAKFSSLKSIVVSMRNSANVNAATHYPNAHTKLGLQSFSARVGSEVIPSTAPTTDAEFFTEVIKCFGSVADMNYQPSVDIDAFQMASSTAITTPLLQNTTNSGAFLLALDFESFQNADKGKLFAGMNTNTSDIFWNVVHTQSGVAAITCLYNAFASFDSVVIFENGVAYVRY